MMVNVNSDKKDCMLLTIEMQSGDVFSDMDIPDMPFGIPNFVQFWDRDRTALMYLPLSEVKNMTIKCVPMIKKEQKQEDKFVIERGPQTVIRMNITKCYDCPYNIDRYESTGRLIGKFCGYQTLTYRIKLDDYKYNEGIHPECRLLK